MNIDKIFINSVAIYNITKNIFNKYFTENDKYKEKINRNITSLHEKYQKFFDIEESKQILSLIEISKTLKTFCVSVFNKIENKNGYYDNEIDRPHKMKTNFFIDGLFNSYKTFDDMVRQMMVDFPREKIYLNNKLYSNINEFINDLFLFDNQINNINIVKLTVGLICQSSFFNSYAYLLNNLHNLIALNKISSDYQVADDNQNKYIYLTITPTDFTCVLKVFYKIINTEDETIMYKISAETIFDIKNEHSVIIYEKL
jgi:hypothetical protein|uniref:Uncharacterized protein n=1 Tax=viral metagenome TaxID=1070528 RepID=A0A6C0DZY2_9ZZZZ